MPAFPACGCRTGKRPGLRATRVASSAGLALTRRSTCRHSAMLCGRSVARDCQAGIDAGQKLRRVAFGPELAQRLVGVVQDALDRARRDLAR